MAAPLNMSDPKERLLHSLGLSPQIYELMSHEADGEYERLTTGSRHLRRNSKAKPPYDWNDITELSKDEAMSRLASSTDQHTSYYWNLGRPEDPGATNWVAKWFLYHKFRYRDGRNKKSDSRSSGTSSRSAARASARATSASVAQTGAYPDQSSYSSSPGNYTYAQYGQAPQYAYATAYSTPTTAHVTSHSGYYPQETGSIARTYYDPVRDQ